MSKKFSTIIGAAAFVSAQFVSAHCIVRDANADQLSVAQLMVRNVFSSYKVEKTVQELAALAGGEGPLVQALLLERGNSTTPFVAIRSEQALLAFASRPEVLATLKQDLSAPNTPGFAQTIITHIEAVSDSPARRELAQVGLQRALGDAAFVPYARMLTFSADSELQKLGAQLPQVVQ